MLMAPNKQATEEILKIGLFSIQGPRSLTLIVLICSHISNIAVTMSLVCAGATTLFDA